MDAKLKSKITISAVVTKANGKVIDYGEIVNTSKKSNEDDEK